MSDEFIVALISLMLLGLGIGLGVVAVRDRYHDNSCWVWSLVSLGASAWVALLDPFLGR